MIAGGLFCKCRNQTRTCRCKTTKKYATSKQMWQVSLTRLKPRNRSSFSKCRRKFHPADLLQRKLQPWNIWFLLLLGLVHLILFYALLRYIDTRAYLHPSIHHTYTQLHMHTWNAHMEAHPYIDWHKWRCTDMSADTYGLKDLAGM